MKICNNISQTIGNTPLVRFRSIEKAFGLEAKIYAKIESFNPAGSAKDRVALFMINDAEEKGLIQPGATIIEPTSGNTGIGLAAVGLSRGYKVILTMPETMSIERVNLLKAYGASVILTEGSKGMQGAVQKAEELAKETENSFIPGQFDNPANPRAHYSTTGPEIYEALDGDADIFVAGVGTGGTITGVGRYLKEKNPDTSVVAIEPFSSPGVGTGGTITGVGRYLKEKNPDTSVVAIEPFSSPLLSEGKAGPHGLQGIGANFVPSILDTDIYDEIITVKEEDAYEKGRLAASLEGFLVGITSGAAIHGAVTLALRPENKGKNIVAFLPDTGDRYLSTPMFSK